MAERENDRRTMLTNWFKHCPTCGRKVHISRRYPKTKSWTCVGCGEVSTIGEMPDVPEAEARRVGSIIDHTPKAEELKKRGGLQG